MARSRLRRWVMRFAVVCAVSGVFLLAVGWAAYLWLDQNILSTLPADLSHLKDWRPPTACVLTDRSGAEVHRFHLERRIWVPLDELDAHTWQAFVAAEDRRFFQHEGVDVLGILRAAQTNWQAGTVKQGGSTITQQLVKNLLVGKEKSYRRKLREAVLALRLERELGKEQILELFLNYVYLGAGNFGVEAAARDYFGVSARDLDPGQAAMIAGLIPAPSVTHPRRAPDLAARRRELVLASMVAEGFLTAEQADAYRDAPVLVPRAAEEHAGLPAAAYVTQVRRELRRLLPGTVAFDRGLEVRTSLDLEVQELAETAIHKAVDALEGRQGRLGPTQRLPLAEWETFFNQGAGLVRGDDDGQLHPPEVGRCFPALVPDPSNLDVLRAGPFTYALDRAQRHVLVRGTAGPTSLQAVVRSGDVLNVCRAEAEGSVVLDTLPWAEGAAVVIENQTGGVLALTGGLRSGLEGFVRATQARRQPGSSFKPYVYATALARGHTQLDPILDGPLSLPAGNGKIWSPGNYSGGFAGQVDLRSALARSLNTPAVRLVLEQGVDETARMAKAMGVHTPLRSDPTMALGSSEVTPMDQALGYATIARGGIPTDPVYIQRIVDFDGVEVATPGGSIVVGGEDLGELPGGPLPPALPPAVAYELADMLREVVRAGTARKAWKEGYDRAGKTGTTNDFLDAWFVGFTPRHTVAVWVGTDGTVPLGESETGGKAALPAWIEIVEGLPAEEGERLPVPDDAVVVWVGGTRMGFPRGQVPAAALGAAPVARSTPLPAFTGGT